jgi:hypothetical protein
MKTAIMISIVISQVAAIVIIYSIWASIIKECSKNNIKNT